MSYEEVLERFNQNLSKIESEYSFEIPQSSWTFEAQNIVQSLIKARDEGIEEGSYFKQDDLLYEKTVSSLAQMAELNSIIDVVSGVNQENKVVIRKKLKNVMSAPLLLLNETHPNSESRNILFELRMYRFFKKLGYEPVLSLGNPDLKIEVRGNTYFIECKRVFAEDNLEQITEQVIKQIQEKSLDKHQGYGIAAISVTRYYHSGEVRLWAKNEQTALDRVKYEAKGLLKKFKDELLRLFPPKIPVVMLEYSDRALIGGKPFYINHIDVVETSMGRSSMFYRFKQDFPIIVEKPQNLEDVV